MASYIIYNENAIDQNYNKIGGDSLLPTSIEWPRDRQGRKMLFLASLSADLLKSQCNITLPEDNILSIFCPYKKDDIACAIDIARGRETGYVVAHLPGVLRQEFDPAYYRCKSIKVG